MLLNPVNNVPARQHELEANPLNPYTFDDTVRSIRVGLDVKHATAQLLGVMTDEEKLSMLDGDDRFWDGLRGILCDRYNRKPFVMGHIARLRIPGIRFTDGPRGIVMHESTCFPVPMSRGATWDPELEQRIGNVIGIEGRAQGANYFAGICINLPRHPAWGRIQETYSEDPLLLGEFGVSLHRGVGPHMMTCVKHFVLNSMENARFKVDVTVDDAALHEVYLAHFRKVVDAGVSSVMSSYNSVRGEFAGENKELLNDILREQWGFDGFVLSDFIFGLRDAVKSVKNGLDIEAPFRQQRDRVLKTALKTGGLDWSEVNLSCSRILKKQLEHSARLLLPVPEKTVVFCKEHRALAREAAARGMVLLKNDKVSDMPLLPLRAETIRTMAVVGRLANKANTGDHGSSAVFAPHVVTAYEGLKAALPAINIQLDDTDDPTTAAIAASQADMTICMVGYDAGDEGEYVVPSFRENEELLDLLPPVESPEDAEVEAIIKGQVGGDTKGASDGIVPGAGGDRHSLRLRTEDVDLLKAVRKVSDRIIVCIVGSGPIIMEEWIEQFPTVVMSWYSGCEGGHALGDCLLGNMDMSGRLPFSVPRSETHLPEFHIDARKITYDRWFGQQLLDKLEVQARFPIGFGLSYTKWSMSNAAVHAEPGEGEHFTARLTVSNHGDRPGRHVVQVYGCPRVPGFPKRVLLGFQAICVGSQDSVNVTVTCSTVPLKRWRRNEFTLISKSVAIEIGAHAGDEDCLHSHVLLG